MENDDVFKVLNDLGGVGNPLPFQGDCVYDLTRRVAAGYYVVSFQDEIFLKYKTNRLGKPKTK
ncbi:MAG: hypothetical protein LBK82_05370 [Planctomycetaceae bacterium]|jgi:hypothetical protein|nr:hypothetical protein [Planctomycetaceae bacterium]